MTEDLPKPQPTFSGLGIVLVARNNRPTLLNADFLVSKGIVPGAWSLTGAPLTTPLFSKVAFLEGLTIVSTAERISFQKSSEPNIEDGMSLVQVVEKYLNTVGPLEYTAVGINPSAFFEFGNEMDVRKHILDCFLPKLQRATPLGALADAAITLSYAADGAIVKITVSHATIVHDTTRTTKEILSFSGNFHHELPDVDAKGRTEAAANILSGTRAEVAKFVSEAIRLGPGGEIR